MQVVKVSGTNSDTSNLMIGIPQGSVLGSFYFFLYTSLIFRLVENTNVEYICVLMTLSYSVENS